MYAKRICGWSRGCFSSPSGHKNCKLISLFFNEIGNYSTSEGLYMNINEGFHSYSDIEYAKENYRDVLESAVIVKCVIPKGTIFFEGEQNFGRGYASNQIIIKEIMKLEDVFPFFDSQAYPYKKGQTIEIINYNVVSTYSVENIVPIHEDYIMLRTNRGILYTSSQGDIF